MSQEDREVPAFACCSAGIGRWFWVAWASEADARDSAPPVASGFEKSAARAEETVVGRLGTEARRLPAKWASGQMRGGRAAGTPRPKPGAGEDEGKPKARFGRAGGQRRDAEPRLAFLYSAIAKEPPDALGHVAVTRHRIVKQTAGKVRVECEPFDEDDWARRCEESAGTPDLAPRPRTLAVDRHELRRDGRSQAGRSQGGLTFYSSEEAGILDVEAALTAKYAWCAALGVRFPCSEDDIKAAYRRLAFASHPDRGGDPAEFRSVERAYRAALAYFAKER